MEFLLRSVKPDGRYAIIVDSEFRLIEHMNQRAMPLHGNFMLPDNFDMIYATSDSGRQGILNKALRTSDKLSNAMIASFKSQNNAKYFADVIDEEAHNPIYVFCAEEARATG